MSTLTSLRYVAESAAEQLRVAEEREQIRCGNCGEEIIEGPSGFLIHKAGHSCCGPNKFACAYLPAEQVQHDHPWTQRNEGSSTSFYSCGICGASVQPMDRETHIEWHQRHRVS